MSTINMTEIISIHKNKGTLIQFNNTKLIYKTMFGFMKKKSY